VTSRRRGGGRWWGGAWAPPPPPAAAAPGPLGNEPWSTSTTRRGRYCDPVATARRLCACDAPHPAPPLTGLGREPRGRHGDPEPIARPGLRPCRAPPSRRPVLGRPPAPRAGMGPADRLRDRTPGPPRA